MYLAVRICEVYVTRVGAVVYTEKGRKYTTGFASLFFQNEAQNHIGKI